jgi:hypothetical protein
VEQVETVIEWHDESRAGHSPGRGRVEQVECQRPVIVGHEFDRTDPDRIGGLGPEMGAPADPQQQAQQQQPSQGSPHAAR